MKYLEFVKNEETQMVENIRFSKKSAKRFFNEMEAANYGGRVALITSLCVEVITYTVENLKEGEKIKMVEINDRLYEMHNHMFSAYLVRLFYNTQYWDILVDAIEFLSKIEVDFVFKVTFYNLFIKLTEEPIDNFVEEVQLVNPSYRVNANKS